MAEGSGLLNRRRSQILPRVRIPVSPLFLFLKNNKFRKCESKVYFCTSKENEHCVSKAQFYLREVVQLGRILGLGPRGRRFESCPPDFKKPLEKSGGFFIRNSLVAK